MAPVRDAVRLVDHQQPHRGGEQGQHLVAEAGVVQSLGADQEQVELVGGQPIAHRVPFVAVGGVDRVRAQPEPASGRQLVAHQRQQRRDDQRRAGWVGGVVSQQRGGDEVDRRLAPAGALHAQDPGAVDGDIADGLELPVAKLGVRRAGQRPQATEGIGGKGCRAHTSTSLTRPADHPALAADQPPIASARKIGQPISVTHSSASGVSWASRT